MGLFDAYGLRWDQIRRAVYRRDGWTCQHCGARGVKLYAHHRRHLARGGLNRLANLETVCGRCHEQEHPHLFARRIQFWVKLFIGLVLLIICLFLFVAFR